MSRTHFRAPGARLGLALVLLVPCEMAGAHTFGKLYNLPIPFWLYAWGAAGALLLSFLLVGYFVTQPPGAPGFHTRDLSEVRWVRILRRLRAPALLKAVSVLSLLLCIATGLFGTRNPYLNFNMTFFWIVFVLGFTYLTALTGDLYALINPWKLAIAGFGRQGGTAFRGRVPYPQGLGCWPALAFYMAFIWLELFAQLRPFSLSVALAAYGAINLAGAWRVGSEAWFRYCEFFGVFLRLVAKMAPLEILPAHARGMHGRLRLRPPFVGLLEGRASSLGEAVFVLFMLSSTAFDGLRETAPWKQLVWIDLRQALEPWLGSNIVETYPALLKIVLACETVCLLASPFIYLAAFLGFIAMAKWLTRSASTIRDLALQFVYSLLPIALVYNVTHYYTLILTQGPQILRLVSDPFGAGWNLFGTARWVPAPIIPGMGVVWHTQVGLILAGHVVSVYLAHRLALRVFPSRRRATLSQLPILLLMVALTTLGLWILALPITAGNAAAPPV